MRSMTSFFLTTALFPVFLLNLVFSLACTGQGNMTKNGFDLSNSLVPADEIRGGGPPKDGIPALTDPNMIPSDQADYLKPDDQVIGVKIKGEARAYPLKILVHHENVNDTVGEKPIAVTY